MAYTRMPSEEWMRILNMADEYEQSRAANEYVEYLEDEITKLKDEKAIKENRIQKATRNKIVDDVMRTPAFKEWLNNHDKHLWDIHHMYGTEDMGF